VRDRATDVRAMPFAGPRTSVDAARGMTTLGEAAAAPHLRGAVRTALLAVAILLVAAVSPASARVDHDGATIPNTTTAGPLEHRVSGPTEVRRLAAPNTPADDPQPALDALGSPADPEEDLLAALRDLASAPDATAAGAARRLALDILEGNAVPELADRAYSGLPLLNHEAIGRTQTVPANGTAVVREVRFGDHALVDPPILEFADPAQPFRITYEIAELGGSVGGFLAPVALLADAQGWLGGQHSILQPLTPPLLGTGTTDVSRFHTGGGDEFTRVRVQRVTVDMPPPRYVKGIVSPNLRAGHDTLSAVRNAEDSAPAVEAALGASPTRASAIAKIGNGAPEKQLWADLTNTDPAVDLAAARAVGANDAQLVAAMTDRDALPGGLAAGMPAADIQAVIVNNEIYLSRRKLALPGSGPVTVALRNADSLTRTVGVDQLSGRNQVFGAIDWGEFDYGSLAAGQSLGPDQTTTFTVTPAGDAFGLMVGDMRLGTEGAAVVELERGPRRESLRFGGSADAPLHIAQGKDGAQWITLEGIDRIARLRPGANLAETPVEQFTLPRPPGLDPAMPLAPHDVEVDPNGIVWATLTLGNAIARIDPAQVQAGTSNGIKVFPLPPCNPECPPPFPPPPVPEPATREPIQMHVSLDGEGNTLVWFNEAAQDSIGLMRVSAGGEEINQAHFPCSCGTPLGIGLDSNGDVWFTETIQNRIGRLRLDQARPFAVSSMQIDHYDIPSGVRVQDPDIGPDPVVTSEAHSIAVDAQDRVWFTESATGKLGMLDPDLAQPDTTQGMVEHDLPVNDFGRAAVPADLTLDRAGNVFWVDEYGDVVGEMTAGGEHRTWRPARRNSLTDTPMIDDQGDLYFLEVGANLLTRLRGVSPGGVLRPGAPPVVTTDLRTGAVSAEGLRATDQVDVVVRRGGAVVGSASDVAVSGGAFRVGAGGTGWAGSAPRPDDVVRITRTGTHELSKIELRVPALTASAPGGTRVEGTARRLGQPLFGPVVLRSGGSTASARIDALDGSYAIAAAPAAGATVAWTEGTPAAQLRTVAAIAGVPDAPPPAPAPAPPSGDSGAPAPPAGPGAQVPSRRPQTTPGPAPACRTSWLRRSGRSFRVPRLGLTAARAQACLGKPRSVRKLSGRRERWSTASGVTLRLTRGKVTGIVLARRGLASTPDRLAVGSTLATLRKALGRGRLDRRGKRYRVTLRSGRRRIAVTATLAGRPSTVRSLDVRVEGST
jgi:streptogramin lyase